MLSLKCPPFHRLGKSDCACQRCGKVCHWWKPFDDVLSWGSHKDRQCRRCGEIEYDVVDPTRTTHGDGGERERGNPSGYDGWGWEDD
jgi:ribosomal protein L37E